MTTIMTTVTQSQGTYLTCGRSLYNYPNIILWMNCHCHCFGLHSASSSNKATIIYRKCGTARVNNHHSECDTKWTTFCRWSLQMHYLVCILNDILLRLVPWVQLTIEFSIASDNALAPNWRHVLPELPMTQFTHAYMRHQARPLWV